MILADARFQPSVPPRRLVGVRLGLASALLGLPLLAGAQVSAAQDGITEDLIRLLIKHNALPREEAEELIRKMQQQTAATASAAPAPAPIPAPAAAGKPNDVRVVYVPADEKQKLQAEIQQNVLATVKEQKWARPDAYPEWLERIAFDGDVRMRYEADTFDGSNSPFFINYQAINQGLPFDVNATNPVLPPLLNTTEDRSMLRARARVGLTARVSDTLTAGFFFATGNALNPVSTNQTFGTDFNRLAFAVDRAYLHYHPSTDWSFWVGRMPSPWFSTEVIWDEDLNFDGLAAQFRHQGATLSPFVTLGAFPVENTVFDFPATDVQKVGSRDKWLYGAQIGAGWHMSRDVDARFGVAYYYYDKVQGATSSPLCPAFTNDVLCDSDISRPSFLQPGNTLFALRDLAADPNNPNGPQFQYFGLASAFHVLDVTARFDMALHGPIRLRFDASYVNNLAYDRDTVISRAPVNNYDLNDELGGGGKGYIGEFTLGYPVIQQFAQWNLTGGYRYLESDAVLAAFSDSDFHLGGTNAKGFFVGGRFGITNNSFLGLRWLSATEVSGAPLAIDVVQFDVQARF